VVWSGVGKVKKDNKEKKHCSRDMSEREWNENRQGNKPKPTTNGQEGVG
jgi:hypothetical protein